AEPVGYDDVFEPDRIVVREGVLGVEESTVDPPGESGAQDDAPPVPEGETPETDDSGENPPQRDRRPMILASVLVALTFVCTGLSAWFYAEADALWQPAQNQALLDNAATSALNGQITDTVQKVFSYDFADTAKTENAAKTLLTGQAIQQYNQLFAM